MKEKEGIMKNIGVGGEAVDSRRQWKAEANVDGSGKPDRPSARQKLDDRNAP